MNSVKTSLLLTLALLLNLQCAVLTQAAADDHQPPLTSGLEVDEEAEDQAEDEGINGDVFEGDILITSEQLEDHYGVPSGLNEEQRPTDQVCSVYGCAHQFRKHIMPCYGEP